MPRTDNLIDGFQKEHSELLGLMRTFHSAIASSNKNEAKQVLDKIDNIASGHFSFEETYLYPRLQRLVREITKRLHSEQETMKAFILESKMTLSKNRMDKDDLDSLLAMLPKLSKFFEDCNKMAFLAEEFDEEEKEYLYKRFKECSKKGG